MNPNISVALSLLLQLSQSALATAQLIKRAQDEGRDITKAELDDLTAQDDNARAALQAEIDRQLRG